MKTERYSVRFRRDSTHTIEVVLYPTKKMMHAAARGMSFRMSHDTVGMFIPTKKPVGDPIGFMFLTREDLTLNTIVHECFHAACYRAALKGLPEDSYEFEEQGAISLGDLFENVIGVLARDKVPVRYEIKGAGPTLILRAERKTK